MRLTFQFPFITLRERERVTCFTDGYNTAVLIVSIGTTSNPNPCFLIRMPYNLPGNLSFSVYNDSVIRMFHNPNTFEGTPRCSDKRALTVIRF